MTAQDLVTTLDLLDRAAEGDVAARAELLTRHRGRSRARWSPFILIGGARVDPRTSFRRPCSMPRRSFPST